MFLFLLFYSFWVQQHIITQSILDCLTESIFVLMVLPTLFIHPVPAHIIINRAYVCFNQIFKYVNTDLTPNMSRRSPTYHIRMPALNESAQKPDYEVWVDASMRGFGAYLVSHVDDGSNASTRWFSRVLVASDTRQLRQELGGHRVFTHSWRPSSRGRKSFRVARSSFGRTLWRRWRSSDVVLMFARTGRTISFDSSRLISIVKKIIFIISSSQRLFLPRLIKGMDGCSPTA